MPLIANNIIVGSQEQKKTPEKKLEVKPVAKPAPVQEPKPVVKETTDHNILVVDGKHKKVSRHSAYMLDMLTIEEE